MNLSNSIADYSNDLKPFALKLTKDSEAANDLVQDTVVKALRYQKSYKEGTNLKGWLYTIMRNTFINAYRSKVRKNTWLESSENLSKISNQLDFNTAEYEIFKQEVMTKLTGLNSDLRLPIMMLYQGYKYEEIAAKLNTPVGTIKSRVFIARRLMRKQLAEYRDYKMN